MTSGAGADGLGRFATDLPAVDDFLTLGEGNTALLPLDTLAAQLGLGRLSAKMETQNPTGSYKDRVAAMSLSLARQQRKRGWIGTSSGNAGLAMAAYGTRAGLPGFLSMVAGAPAQKRQPLMPYDVRVVSIDGVGHQGTGATATRLTQIVQTASEQHDLFLGITAHAFNPEGMRGVDTISYELTEQAPDVSHVYVPTGGGGLLVAVARGLEHRGVAAKLVACQPSGCAPIADCVNGRLPEPVIDRCDSNISALQLPAPPDGNLAVDAVRTSGGWGVAVDDAAILLAQRLLAQTEGIFVEPASAAAIAAVIQDVEQDRLARDVCPVVILTGHGWKDMGRFASDADRMPRVSLNGIDDMVHEWATHLDGAAALPTPPIGGRR